jgi:hypothetical protein
MKKSILFFAFSLFLGSAFSQISISTPNGLIKQISSGAPVTPADAYTKFTVDYNTPHTVIYQWYVNGVPARRTIHNTFTFTTPSTPGKYEIYVTSSTACSVPVYSDTLTVVVQGTPCPTAPQPIFAAAPSSVCAGGVGFIYSVDSVPGVHYTWLVPSANGWAITSGQNTASITVTAGTANGTITCTPSNTCGDGTPAIRTVTVTATTPAVISPTDISELTIPCSLTLTATPSGGTRTWSSSDTAVATITNAGVLTPKDTGRTTVTFTYTNSIGCTLVATKEMTVVAQPELEFLPYNLGVSQAVIDSIKASSTPNKRYMAFFASATLNQNDTTYYGAIYQWGRVADGYQRRNSTYLFLDTSNPPLCDANGQILLSDTTHYGKFVFNNLSPGDWHVPQNDSLWGNGKTINIETPGCGPTRPYESNPQHYQCTDWAIPANNPCPDGYRIPTQDEWERLLNYDCDPSLSYGSNVSVNYSSPKDGYHTTTGYVWVPVTCTSGACYNDTTGWGIRSSYTVYKKSDWDGFHTTSGDLHNLLDPLAPEPYLFLPLTGYRTTGNYDTGRSGRYWSSTSSNAGAAFYCRVGFNQSISASISVTRSTGQSVRCVKE